MKKISIIIIGLFICFSGCKKDEQVVRIAHLPSLGASQLYVGIANGYFKDEGIKVEISEIYTGADQIAAIQGKSIDIGFAVVLPPLINARLNGVKIKSIGGATFDSKDVRDHRIMLHIDSEIQTAQDLRGKKIAVISTVGTDYFALLNYLKDNGIQKEEVEIISVPAPEMIFALTSKAVDAVAGLEPFITMGAVQKKTRTFDYYYPDQITEVVTVVAHEDFINDNPELVAKISRVIERATAFIHNEEEFRKLLPAFEQHGVKFKMSKEVADSVTIMGFKNCVTPAGVETVMDMLIEIDLLKTKINAEDLIYSSK